jgi:hypothetical protein
MYSIIFKESKRLMDDISTFYLVLQRLSRSLYEEVNNKNYAKAHEISIDMVDIAQKLEDISKKLRDANNN